MEWHRSEQAKELAAAAINEYLAGVQNTPVLLLLSGGSWFELYELVVLPERCDFLTIGVLDERFTRNPEDNNYLTLSSTTFFQTAVSRGAQTIDTSPGSHDRVEKHARTFDIALRSWVKQHQTGVLAATIGVGSDGHVAGILPGVFMGDSFQQLFDGEKWVVGYEALFSGNPYKLRSTTTFPFLRKLQKSFVYLGSAKCTIAKKLMDTPHRSLEEMPASILHEMKSVDIFTSCL